ncbi:hypothetical protein E4U15_000645 [Claviceps sp. LM218 group G6]|nr:hypothetical protein E4U15_000645 [Claviceps sp. LM218 group G6]
MGTGDEEDRHPLDPKPIDDGWCRLGPGGWSSTARLKPVEVQMRREDDAAGSEASPV